jgi:uncharacterized protein
MKKLILACWTMALSQGMSAQHAESITIGKKETLFSSTLQENRKCWVYHPTFSKQNADSKTRYPVLYVLDGDAHFLSTVGIVQQLSQANGNGVLPEMIVVAIENTNRLRDLTPAPSSGGNMDKANPFLTFLSKELMPYIDTHYNAAPYKVLIGHSLGGLTAVDAMTNFPTLFNSFIAIDPSMWFMNEIFLNQTMSQLPKLDHRGKKLFIGMANTMPAGMSLSSLSSDRSPETQHIRSILKLDSFLRRSNHGLAYTQNYYVQENHNSVPLLSVYDGLRFIFDYYPFTASEKDFADTSARIAAMLTAHYAKVSDEMGYRVAAPVALIKYLGYDALNKKQYARAEALFKLNMDSYPDHHVAYDAYGDYLATQKDTIRAITFYRKALQMTDDPVIRHKINQLSGKETFRLPLEALKKYAGVYILETYQLAIILEIRNGTLWSKVPGQANNQLVPVLKNVFTVWDKPGYTITFQMKDDKPTGFTAVQPNGTFIARYKQAP